MRWILISILINIIAFELQAKPIKQNSKISNNMVATPISATFTNKSGVAIPREINYQGWLGNKNDTLNLGITENLDMKFAIYNDSTMESTLWNETQKNVPVIKGIFNVLLGSINPIPVSIFTGIPLWIETQIGSQVLVPRKKLVSVPYAIKAENSTYADTVKYVVICSTYVIIDSTSPHFLRKDRPDTTYNYHKCFFGNPDTIPEKEGCIVDIRFNADVNNGSSAWNGLYVGGNYNNFIYSKGGANIMEVPLSSSWLKVKGHQGGTKIVKYIAIEGIATDTVGEEINNCSLVGIYSWARADAYAGSNVGDNVSLYGFKGIVSGKDEKANNLVGLDLNLQGGTGSKRGISINISGKSNADVYGDYISIANDNNSINHVVYGSKRDVYANNNPSYGYYANMHDTTGTRASYGFYSVNTGVSTGAKYGLYSNLTNANGGAGIFSVSDSFALMCSTSAESKNYAGYFAGNVKVNGTLTTDSLTTNNLITNNNLILSNEEIILSDGDNVDVVLSNNKIYFRISGPTSSFSISGFSGGIANRIIIIYNATNQNMTIKNNSGIAPVNGIYTLKDADITTNGSGSITLIYDGTEQRWVMTNWQE
ncbi:MAG: hypothetical protein PHX21_10490 [bacterium]|nr:hypothetical protein [bacterium]